MLADVCALRQGPNGPFHGPRCPFAQCRWCSEDGLIVDACERQRVESHPPPLGIGWGHCGDTESYTTTTTTLVNGFVETVDDKHPSRTIRRSDPGTGATGSWPAFAHLEIHAVQRGRPGV
jgi:hypothetical protein